MTRGYVLIFISTLLRCLCVCVSFKKDRIHNNSCVLRAADERCISTSILAQILSKALGLNSDQTKIIHFSVTNDDEIIKNGIMYNNCI